MKKILLIIMLFSGLIILNACGTTEEFPTISNPDENYLTIKDGSKTYSVKNSRVYDSLRGQVGYSVLMDLIDKDLLKHTKKDNVSFWDQITQEEIIEKYEEDVYGDDKDTLSEEEQTEKEEKHLDGLFAQYGLTTKEDVLEFYHLSLAKEYYAKDQLDEQIAEKDFTDSEYKTYFNNNYSDEFYAIVVSFDSVIAFNNALKQLGYQLVSLNILNSQGEQLTENQFVKLIIELYNMVNAHKVEGYPDTVLSLREGYEYTLEDNKVVFPEDLEKIEILKYIKNELSAFESSIQNAMKSFDNYVEGENSYTTSVKEYQNGAENAIFLKIAEVKHKFEDEKSDIKEELTKQKLTNSFINKEMLKLRVKNNIVIYDQLYNENFLNILTSEKIEYTNPEATHNSLVVKTNVKEYSADELFAAMNKNYGVSAAISEIEFMYFIENPKINNIYDFSNNKVINQTRWDIIQQAIKDEKKSFGDDLYKDEGYPKSMGWAKFIKDVYGVDSDTDLQKFFVFQEVKDSYSKSFASLEGLDENSDLWQHYKTEMEESAAEYFNVTGVHLLITMYDDSRNPVDPEKWTENQIGLAEDFYNQIMDLINNETITDKEIKKLQNVDNALNRAPYFVAGLPNDSNSQPVIPGLNYVYNGVEVSKFKSAGFVALFQDLGSFTNGGNFSEKFSVAAKTIWDLNDDSEETVVYGSTKDEEGLYDYLVSEFGYHIYVNTKTTPMQIIQEGKILPNINDAKKFIKDNNDSSLSTKLKNSLNQYFLPIYNELISSSYLQVNSYKDIKELDINLNHNNYSLDNLHKFLDLTIENLESRFKYN